MAGVMCDPLGVNDVQILDENGEKVDVAVILTKGTYIESFLHNNIKTNQLEISTDSKTFKTFAKLKEPRDLFALPKELDCPQQAARWPTECQVVEEKIQHITWIPATPEPYYVKTGKELQPQPVGEDAGTVVFQYYPMSAVNYFSRSSVGGSRIYLSACASANSDDDLRFESRFESGNLAKAIRITSSYYELHLRTDLYTNRHMQWFYFRISNTTKNMTYRFSIVNLSKPNSLFNDGMRPLLYSTKDAQLHSIGWKRCGENIAYYRNDPTCEEEEQNPTYTLTFNIQFPHSEDTVYLAHCFPYTYSDLQEYLSKLQAHPVKSIYTKLRLLCRTLAGNNVYYLTITSPTNPNAYIEKKKKAIIITARVHPGETPASWMMKGFMDFLTGDTSQARELRDKFIFKLVPMLNPDGVIVGNNRCSLTGKDLNRQYRTVIRETYPSVWHTKVLVRRLQEECGVAMFVDLHAHSRRHNVFIYGCESRRGSEKRLHEQVFPLMLHKNAADKFSFESCKFRIQRSKEGTGRVVVWMMGIANSYTMEATFAGSELGSRMSTHFTTQDYENIGKTFCETLLDFYDEDPSKEKLRAKIITRLLKEGSSADEPTNIDLSDYSSDEGDTSTSSSEAEATKCDVKSKTVVFQPAPPPSPVLTNVFRANNENTKKSLSKIEKAARSRNRLSIRQTLSVNNATIDLTSDVSTEGDSADESSPTRRIRTLFRSSIRSKKNGRRKKMPPELTITPVQTNIPVLQTENDKEQPRSSRSKSLTVPSKPSLSHQFRSFPAPKCLTELKSNNRNAQPTELEVKLTSLKKTTVWTRSPGDNEPLSWGISSITKHAYFTEGESLLRLCSKKLEELETYGDKDEKIKNAKRKGKTKPRQTFKPLKIADETSAITEKKPFQLKKKKKKKKVNQEGHSLEYSSSFSEARKPITKSYSYKEDFNPTRSFRKGGYVATAIQNKTIQNKSNKKMYSDQSDSDDSNDSIKKTKRPTKSIKIKLFKTKSNESRK